MSEAKKTLKSYINENGFFLKMHANKVERSTMEEGFSTNAVSTGIKLPTGDNIILFRGIASQNYAKGEKNRNGYKIDPKGWDYSNYKNNPIILLQHDDDYGGIGHALKFELTSDGINILFFVDLNTLDEKTAYQVSNGYIKGISTGHITISDGIEDVETGTVYSIEEADEKFGWGNVWEALMGISNMFTYVVTGAEMVENSLVSIGSNAKAIAFQNAIGQYAQNKYKDKALDLSQHNKMTKTNNVETTDTQETVETTETTTTETTTTEVETNNTDTVTDEVTTETTTETVATPEEVTTEENSTEVSEEIAEDTVKEIAGDETPGKEVETTEGTNTQENSIDTNVLTNKVVELTAELTTLKNTNKALEDNVAELHKQLEEGAKVINTQNEIIERAMNLTKKQGIAFNGTDLATGKTWLENRMKKVD